MVRQRTGRKKSDKFKNRCKLCNEIIFDKQDNSLYCKEHATIIADIKNRFKILKFNLKRKYPDLKIEIRIDIEEKC